MHTTLNHLAHIALSLVDRIPTGATGSLWFGDEGVIHLDHGRICWISARRTKGRLIELLAEASGLSSFALAELRRRSEQESPSAYAEALFAEVQRSPQKLCDVLRRHSAESLLVLGAEVESTRWQPRTARGFSPTVSFSKHELSQELDRVLRTERPILRKLRTVGEHTTRKIGSYAFSTAV